MDEQPTYQEWLRASRHSLDASRRLFLGTGDTNDSPRYDDTGHPLNHPFPPTGDAKYDARKPHRQVHGRTAQEMAGFDARTLARIRRALDAGEKPILPPGWVHFDPRDSGSR